MSLNLIFKSVMSLQFTSYARNENLSRMFRVIVKEKEDVGGVELSFKSTTEVTRINSNNEIDNNKQKVELMVPLFKFLKVYFSLAEIKDQSYALGETCLRKYIFKKRE